MSKRSFSRRSSKSKGSKSPKMSPNNMMAQMQKMQEEMASAQESLANETVTVTAGGGAISITVTGHQRIQAIQIDPDVIDPDDVEMLQDMLVAAVNAAIEQSQTMAAEKMEGITGDLGGLGGGLDGLLGGLGGV